LPGPTWPGKYRQENVNVPTIAPEEYLHSSQQGRAVEATPVGCGFC
jgi:hypothetical protein